MEINTLKSLIVGRCGIEVGKRQLKRISMFFPTEELFNKASTDALNCIIYACQDISAYSIRPFFDESMTRSKRVMFYRKCDLVLKKIAKLHVMSTGLSSEAVSSEMNNKICKVGVPEFRFAYASLISEAYLPSNVA